jgi:citrate lyase beta subunit
VHALDAQPEVGTILIDGVMVDRPHLVQALATSRPSRESTKTDLAS